jgi:hypothetical protein
VTVTLQKLTPPSPILEASGSQPWKPLYPVTGEAEMETDSAPKRGGSANDSGEHGDVAMVSQGIARQEKTVRNGESSILRANLDET